ncbi:hypothetical protein [Brachyspira sp. G79]|uniref:hypothetical protein n=1 Tax=Brachyspira sp. G79 TaxID=1358104 RepID=UPI000BBBA2AF|nr:hypothetical protein [Brachyspira sp. G79]PCG20556.1 hypothetical protein KQ44_11530 [Brachyspira sp. G79]
MLSLFDTAKRILKSFFDDNLFSIDNILSSTKIEALVRAIDKGIKKDYDKVLKSVNKEVRSKLKNEYNKFIKKGVFRTAPSLQKYKIEDLKPDFKKELESRINVSLSYITTQDKNTIEEIKNRLMNFVSIPHPNKNLKELEYDFWNDVLPEKAKKNYKTNKWQNMIIRDQQHKLVSNMTYITATKNNAIGFIWKNRKDIRVVGNPSGLYPKGDKMHNNHWQREGKLYLFRNSEALKKGLIKKTKDVHYADEIEDGLPGIPINCRCTMRLIYRLYEIPAEYKNIITKKGLEYS